MNGIARHLAGIGCFVIAAAVFAAPNDWAEGMPGKDTGATREYYNRAGYLAWKNPMGDWVDAKGIAQGADAFAVAEVAAGQKETFVEWDVTALARLWHERRTANQGFFLRVVKGSGTFAFSSREGEDAKKRPQLVITGEQATATLTPTADTYLESSTYRGMGGADKLMLSNRPNNILVRFDLDQAKNVGTLTRAVLRLYNTTQTSGARATVGVFRCQQGHDVADQDVVRGLADAFPADCGIRTHADVLFFDDFEGEDWKKGWSSGMDGKFLAIVAADDARKFVPFAGKALSANIAKGELTSLNLLFKFKDKTGSEPEEMFARYYLRLGDDWNQTVSGGKLPGFSGTYGKAGWGGRKSNGSNGWSARGWFALSIPTDNPLAGLHPIGTYCYHTDQAGIYGDTWVWQRGYRGYLEKNRWYCVEQSVKLNTPGEKNGTLRAWIDGRLAFEKTDLRFRQVDRLKIEQLWMNVYHGGTQPSPEDQHVFIDHVVIAKSYIGPMKMGGTDK